MDSYVRVDFVLLPQLLTQQDLVLLHELLYQKFRNGQPHIFEYPFPILFVQWIPPTPYLHERTYQLFILFPSLRILSSVL
jgi:hypothetical protein